MKKSEPSWHFERRIRLADSGTQGHGVSHKWHSAGFLARFADFDDNKDRMETENH